MMTRLRSMDRIPGIQRLADFEAEEYQARLEKARRRMRERGLDAIVLTTETNHRYLSGHWTDRWYNWSRPILSVFPVDDDPVVIASATEAPMVQMTSWIEEIYAYTSYDHSAGAAIDTLEAVLKSRGLADRRVGFELGTASRLGLPLLDFTALRAELSELKVEDCADLLWELRRVKSPAEIDIMRRAAEITNRVFDEVLSFLAEGQTEHEVGQWVHKRMLENGADRLGYVVVRSNITDPLGGTSGDRVIALGNLVYIDAGCVVRGYWSDYNRYFAVGELSSEVREGYSLIWELMEASLAAVKPGNKIGDVYAAYEDALRSLGTGVDGPTFGRIGHSIGLDQCEAPSISKDSPLALTPGMVLCIEPNCPLSGAGQLIGEEEIVVTETGFELLSARARRHAPRVAS